MLLKVDSETPNQIDHIAIHSYLTCRLKRLILPKVIKLCFGESYCPYVSSQHAHAVSAGVESEKAFEIKIRVSEETMIGGMTFKVRKMQTTKRPTEKVSLEDYVTETCLSTH